MPVEKIVCCRFFFYVGALANPYCYSFGGAAVIVIGCGGAFFGLSVLLFSAVGVFVLVSRGVAGSLVALLIDFHQFGADSEAGVCFFFLGLLRSSS